MILFHAVRRPAEHGMRSNGPTLAAWGENLLVVHWRKIDDGILVPSWELTYPLSKAFLKIIFLFSKVGYVSSLEGIHLYPF